MVVTRRQCRFQRVCELGVGVVGVVGGVKLGGYHGKGRYVW